jgi:predicted ATPase
VERIETGIDLAITASRTLKRMPPIFLFDAPETRVTGSDIHKLAQLIATTAKTYQCCYLCRNAEFFRPAETARNYTCSDLKVPNS